ncbi:MAG TPA: DUF6152 family protein [Pseudomonadales bacterium]
MTKITASMATLALSLQPGVSTAHHSFAMYDTNQTYVMTGIVTRVDPNPNHLQMFIAPLNVARDQVLKDDKGEPVVWAIEMDGAAVEARSGVTVNGFPRGTIVSVGLHPLRNGFPGGGRGESGLFRCPADTPPAPGMHCDSVAGAMPYGDGVLPAPTGAMPGVQ